MKEIVGDAPEFHVEKLVYGGVATRPLFFVLGVFVGLAAVGEVSGKRIGSGGVGPVTRRLYAEFRDIVSRPEEGTPIFRAEKIRQVRKR